MHPPNENERPLRFAHKYSCPGFRIPSSSSYMPWLIRISKVSVCAHYVLVVCQCSFVYIYVCMFVLRWPLPVCAPKDAEEANAYEFLFRERGIRFDASLKDDSNFVGFLRSPNTRAHTHTLTHTNTPSATTDRSIPSWLFTFFAASYSVWYKHTNTHSA